MQLLKNPSRCKECFGIGWRQKMGANGYTYVEPCNCFRRDVKVEKFGEKFVESTLDNYESRNKSCAIAKKALKEKPDGSFFIFGNVDLGKTHLLAAFYEYQFEKSQKKIKVYKEAQLKYELQGMAVGSYGWKQNPKETVKDMLKDVKAVFIDDIAKVKVDDKIIEGLFVFYDTIYEMKLQLVISANYALSEPAGSTEPSVAKIYGAAIASRIERICDLIHIVGGEDLLFDKN